jgi:hypothetical protein
MGDDLTSTSNYTSTPGVPLHEQLAQKVLVYFATVPISSGMIIVQTFPLLVAGCEAAEKENRDWVTER